MFMEEELEFVKKSLESIKEEREQAIKRTEENLSKLNKDKDPKIYAEGEEELKRRKEELEKINKSIEDFEDKEEILKKFDFKKLKQEKEYKQNALNKAQEALKNVDKNRDPKLYAEIEEEIAKRNKELDEVKEKEQKIEKSKNKIEKIKNIYKIKKEDKEEDKNELNKAEKINPKKESKKQIYKSKFELSPEELNEYTELLRESNGKNSEKLNEFYKKLAEKRSNEIKNAKKDAAERKPDGTLKYPPVLVKNEEKTVKKHTAERNPDGTLKYPPVLKKEKTPTIEEKMKIVYRGDKNKYYIEDNGVKKVFNAEILKNKKAKMQYLKDDFTKDELKYIFGDDYEDTMKKMVKAKIDPQLLSILSEKSLDYAKSYVDEFAKGETEEEKDLPYSMTYNLKDMRKEKENTKLSFFDRIKMSIMAKKNEKAKVAEYIPDTKSRKWLIFPIVGALATGGIYALDKGSEKDKNPDRSTPTPVVNTVEPTTKTPDENEPTINLDENNIIENDDTKEDVALKLGSRVYMKEGISYAETSTQTGRNAKIGDFSWRPQGEYTVDRMALYLNGSLIANIGTEGTNIDEAVKQYAAQYNVEPSQIVQKAHICILEGHGGPTGWIDMDEMSIEEIKENITKTYDQIQAEKQQQAQSQNQNNVQQQTGNER